MQDHHAQHCDELFVGQTVPLKLRRGISLYGHERVVLAFLAREILHRAAKSRSVKSRAFLVSILCLLFIAAAREKATASVFCEADVAAVLAWDTLPGLGYTGLEPGRFALVLFA